MLNRLRGAHRQVSEFFAEAGNVQPGEVWSIRYNGTDRWGHPFEDWVAGHVYVDGDALTLGEYEIVVGSGVGRTFDFLHYYRQALRGHYTVLQRGDAAPKPARTGDALYALHTFPEGAHVAVECRDRDPHPADETQRNVVVGSAHTITTRGERGRMVGDVFVPFRHLTAVAPVAALAAAA